MFLAGLVGHATSTPCHFEGWQYAASQRDLTWLYALATQAPLAVEKYEVFHSQFLSRAEHYMNADKWTIKIASLYTLSPGTPFVDYCSENKDTALWMTHRANIHEQFISYVNAAYRGHILRDPQGGYVYKKDSSRGTIGYDSINMSSAMVGKVLQTFIQSLVAWRLVYEKYKDCTNLNLVSYEKHIEQANLEQFGISAQVLEQYNAGNPIIKTPYNTTKFNDSSIWPFCSRVLNDHTHIVDVEI